MAMSASQRKRLRNFFASADTERMTLHDAGRHVRQLAPLYQPRDALHRITAADGTRWYADPLDALVDEIWRATHRPHRTETLLSEALGSMHLHQNGFVGLQRAQQAMRSVRR